MRIDRLSEGTTRGGALETTGVNRACHELIKANTVGEKITCEVVANAWMQEKYRDAHLCAFGFPKDDR